MGVSTETNTNADLLAIYQGGDNFLARMKAMAEQQSAIESMLAELRLGREAKAALADAKTKQAEAEAILTDAKNTAEQTVSTAQAAATKARVDADSYAAKVRSDADQLKTEVDAIKLAADNMRAEAVDFHANIAGVKQDLEKSISAAKASKDRFDGMIGVLQSAMDAASKL